MSVKVTVQVSGGDPQLTKATTVGDLKAEFDAEDYAATVNGEPADDDQELEAYQFVSLSPAVKGGV